MTARSATFTYWDSDDLGAISAHLEHWRGYFPAHSVVTRDAARRLLAHRSPRHLETFDRIAIPACRSDIARLLQLEAEGGLYVDAHCAVLDPDGILARHRLLDDVDLVVSTRHAPNFARIMPHNSIVWCRPGAPVVSRLLDKALENLAAKAEREQIQGFEPYHVWDLTGPGVFWRELFDVEATEGELKADWDSKVAAIFEPDNPIRRHVFVGYRGPGDHWSERQRSECLFNTPRT